MIYLAFAVLAALVALALVWPLLRARSDGARRDGLVVYRDQLEELDRDLARGLIDAGGVAAARREIERRIIAEGARHDAPAPARTGRRLVPAGLVTLVVVAGAAVIYADLGSPELPALPFDLRQDAQTPAVATEEEAQINEMIARLEQRLADNPGDADGWLLLANTNAFVGRYSAAAQAMTEVLAIDPENGEWQAAYGEFVALDHQGTVTPAARRAFETALLYSPGEPVARYYLAMADAQAGDVAGALAAWRELYAETPADAAWRDPLIARIGEAEQQLGMEPSVLPPATPAMAQDEGNSELRGPTEDDIAAAQDMTADDQLDMIRGMVAGLSERMAGEPDNLEGWSRLAQSYGVLGEWDKAQEAYEHLLTLAPEDPGVLDGYANAIASGLDQNAPIPAGAVARFDILLQRAPDIQIALYITGLAAAQSGDNGRATQRWTRLRDQFPPDSAEWSQVNNLIAGLQ